MSIDKIASDLLSAMKSGNKSKLDSIRNIKKKLADAPGAVKDAAVDSLKSQAESLAEQGKNIGESYLEQKFEDVTGIDADKAKSFIPENLSEDELAAKVKLGINEVASGGSEEVQAGAGIANTAIDNKDTIKGLV